MIPLLLLHGEGPIFAFLAKVGIAVPLLFAVLAWLAWWIRKGRYLSEAPARVVLKAGVALLLSWLLGLAALVAGVGLNIALAICNATFFPDWAETQSSTSASCSCPRSCWA